MLDCAKLKGPCSVQPVPDPPPCPPPTPPPFPWIYVWVIGSFVAFTGLVSIRSFEGYLFVITYI